MLQGELYKLWKVYSETLINHNGKGIKRAEQNRKIERGSFAKKFVINFRFKLEKCLEQKVDLHCGTFQYKKICKSFTFYFSRVHVK